MDASTTPPAGQPPKSNATKWILFGCGGGCLLLIVVVAVFFGGIVSFVFGVMKNSEPYQTALKRAQDSAEVQAVLGTPIEGGTVVTGNINGTGDSGSADIRFSIKGPKGEGTVVVKGSAVPGQGWTYTEMKVVEKATGKEIDLRNAPAP